MRNSLERLQSIADQQAIVETLIKWTEGSSNEDLLLFRDCAVRQIAYCQTLELHIERLSTLRDDLRDSNLKDRVRATEAEKALQDALEEVERLKKQLALFV